jgi:hypothetical protein
MCCLHPPATFTFDLKKVNMKTIKQLFAIGTLAFFTLSLSGQTTKTTDADHSYRTGIGLRLGYESGLTIKHFISGNGALEGILSRGWRYGGLRITGLYEFQKGFANAKGLEWFAGIGAHIGFFDGGYYGYRHYGEGYYDKNGNWHPTGYRDRYTTVGIDGILGLEYIFAEVPFSVSLDIKPYFDLIGRGDHFGDAALSIRYVIK